MNSEAAVRRNVVESVTTASIFDIVAEDSLRTTLKPAWNYLLKFLQKKYPNKFKLLQKYSDESFLLLQILLEEYSLRKFNATITEQFYKLERHSSAAPNSFLSRNYKLFSLISVTILPYMVEKLGKTYQNMKTTRVLSNRQLTSFERLVLKLHPPITFILKWLRIVNYLLYIIGRSTHPYPLLHLLKIQLVYGNQNSGTVTNAENKKFIVRVLQFFPELIATLLSKLAPFLFYSLQFLDTFYQQDSDVINKSLQLFNVATPPAPPKVRLLLWTHMWLYFVVLI